MKKRLPAEFIDILDAKKGTYKLNSLYFFMPVDIVNASFNNLRDGKMCEDKVRCFCSEVKAKVCVKYVAISLNVSVNIVNLKI